MSKRPDVIVIGGGVIGLACANALLDRGRSVTILERDRVGSGASDGNCGLITPSHAVPLNRPGLIRDLLGWLGRESSPLLVRPRLDPTLLAWGIRFLRNCTRERVLAILKGRAALLESSRELFVEMMDRDGLDCEWQTLGMLEVFATEKAMESAQATLALLEEHGLPVERHDRQGLLAREPALRDDVHGGWWHGRDAQLRPERLVRELARIVRAKGAVLEEETPVRGLEPGGHWTSALTGSARFDADRIVLATGAWSPVIARHLGLRLPVQPGKGYSITMQRPDPCPRQPLLLSEAKMAVTPWESGYRLGGTMELAGYDDRLRPSRLEVLRAGARRYLRAPEGEGPAEEWWGWRPMTPDELPIIDRVPEAPNVLVATGHGMMGVSMAPATGRLVAEMIVGETPFVDPAPYSLGRFR